MTERVWVFDMDDTLIYNSYRYKKPAADFVDFLIKRIFEKTSLIATYIKFLVSKLDKQAFSLDRYVREIEERRKQFSWEEPFKALTDAMVDTTEHFYDLVGLDFFGEDKLTVRSIGLHMASFYGKKLPDELLETRIITHFEKTNRANVKLFAKQGNGYSTERQPTTFIQTFEFFANEQGKEVTEKDRIRLYKLGKEFCNIEYDVMPEVPEVLNFLLENNDIIKLYSKGDLKLQRRKIEVNKLKKWFSNDNILIVPEKRDEFPEELVKGLDKTQIIVVGNSKGSDIEPAINADLKGILIPFDTWSHERKRDQIANSKNSYIVMKSIIEIKDQYHCLDEKYNLIKN
ncbi:hypothetical protein HQ533_02580 [Candidatus Woesearchaeota archaeon]|nr:hypothetical protein [Candidatus Woesearchaeota archaeon]